MGTDRSRVRDKARDRTGTKLETGQEQALKEPTTRQILARIAVFELIDYDFNFS